ncbi:hypothetical protein, partial [Streptomyces sp. NPDC056527]|uniref:hypothetical protein n=1 Tax=Streptomyces sp. NPDC056527 TaxID=3345853 RepID=UPI0036A3C8FB
LRPVPRHTSWLAEQIGQSVVRAMEEGLRTPPAVVGRRNMGRLLQQVEADDAADEIDWNVSVDSTIVRARQHAAGARTDPSPVITPKGAEPHVHQGETAGQRLHVRLVAVGVERQVRLRAARAAGSPPSFT